MDELEVPGEGTTCGAWSVFGIGLEAVGDQRQEQCPTSGNGDMGLPQAGTGLY